MAHSFEDLYNLYRNQPDGPDAEIAYFRQNGIRQINVNVRDDQATVVMIDANGQTHRATGRVPQEEVPPQAAQEDLGYEGKITSDPLSVEERSIIDPNPDIAIFTNQDAFHGSYPEDRLQELGITNQGTWFNTYREGLRYRYNPPSEDINNPTSPEDAARITETSKLKFKYKLIKQQATKLAPMSFPFTVETRGANRVPFNRAFPPVKVEFTLLDAIYFATLHPHIIAGFTVESRGFLFRETKYKFLYLEKTSTEDEPGTRLAREIMVGRGMYTQTATASTRKPVMPLTAQTIPTKAEQKELDSTTASLSAQENQEKQKQAERRSAGTSRNASLQMDGTKPLGRQVLYAKILEDGAVWVSQLPNAKPSADPSVGETSLASSITNSHLNRIVQAAGDDGLLDDENDGKWSNINEYTGDFYDTTTDPGREKFAYEIKKVGNTVYIQKLEKVQNVTPTEQKQEADASAITSNNRTEDAYNYDDWTTNINSDRGVPNSYYNPRYPESVAVAKDEGSYFVVMKAPADVEDSLDYRAEEAELKELMYRALCNHLNKPITDMPSTLSHEMKTHFDPRPNSAPLIALIIKKTEFDKSAASGNIKTDLDELTLQRAILTSQKRSEKNISFTLEKMDPLFETASHIVRKYARIVAGQGLGSADIGVNLYKQYMALSKFTSKVRSALAHNGVYPDASDQIEIGFTNDYQMLHIIHKSRMYFSGFKRATIDNEIAVTLEIDSIQDQPEGQFPSQLESDKNYFRIYKQTEFGYVFFAEEIVKNNPPNASDRKLTPWVDFVRLYTYPAPTINPTKVNNKNKLTDDGDDQIPSQSLTDTGSEIESDDIIGSSQVAYVDKSASKPGTQIRTVTQSQKESEAINIRSFIEKKQKIERKAKSLEPLVEDAVMNCGNLPQLLDQIKELSDLFDLVLDQISLDELFAALRDSLLQDLQKLFAMKDLAEGYTPGAFAGAGDQGEGLDTTLSTRASKLVCAPSSEFEDFLQNDLACALDQIGDSLKNQLLGRDLNNLPLDQLVEDRIRNLFGISIPFIPIEGILSFILKIVSEILKEALRQVLVALVQEALEKYLDCENIPLLDDNIAKLGDIKNPAQLLEYGKSRLGDLIGDIDLNKLVDELGIELPLEQLQEVFEKVSDCLNSMEMLALLSGNAGPLIMQLVREQFGGLLLDDQIDLLFDKIGDNVSDEIKNGIVPEEFYVDYCNKADYVRASSKALDLLRDKGLTDEQIKNQADEEIKRAADKIKSMCDFENLANNALINALNNIKAPDAIVDLQSKASSNIAAIAQAGIKAEAKPFILGRTPPKYGGFNLGSLAPLIPFPDPTYGSEQLVRVSDDRNLALKGSGGKTAERVEVSYNSEHDEYRIGNLRIVVSTPTSDADRGPTEQAVGINDEIQEKPNDIVTIIVHDIKPDNQGVRRETYVDEFGQFIESKKEELEQDRNVLVFLQTQPDRNYSRPTHSRLPRFINRPRELGEFLNLFLSAHQENIYGFGITSDQIEEAYIVGSEEDGEAAYLRAPESHEAGKYPYPLMENLVIDRGNDMEIFNAFFRKDDINLKKNPRQDYFESGIFNAGKAYEKLYADLQEEPTLVNAGPNFEKKVKRTTATVGIGARLMPFFCAIWPLFNAPSGQRIRFASKGEGQYDDRIFREIIENYLTRKITFQLENLGVLDMYNKVLAEDDFEIADVVSVFLDGIFVDNPDESNKVLYEAINFNDSIPTSGQGSTSQHFVLNVLGTQDGVSNYNAVRDNISRSVYPVEPLLAVSTIYLETSCNATGLLGTSFVKSSIDADQLLRKFFDPLI